MATPDAKKESFRKYLDSAGLIDSLTRVLVALYEEPERPEDPVKFLVHSLGAKTAEEFDSVNEEKEFHIIDDTFVKESYKQKVQELEAKIQELESKLESQGAQGEGQGE